MRVLPYLGKSKIPLLKSLCFLRLGCERSIAAYGVCLRGTQGPRFNFAIDLNVWEKQHFLVQICG